MHVAREDRGVGIVHLVHGYLGAGKTTYARTLAAATGGIRLSADEWYLRLHVGDEGTHHLDDELWSRTMDVLTDLWPELAARDVDVILDFGFWSRSMRDEARRLAEGAGASVVLYDVRCAEAVARQRCRARNEDTVGSFIIDDAAFDALKAKFEPLGVDEEAEIVDTTPS